MIEKITLILEYQKNENNINYNNCTFNDEPFSEF